MALKLCTTSAYISGAENLWPFWALMAQEKTTLARHLNGLLKPTQGRVLVAGQDTRQTTPAQLSRFVGYLFQDPDDEIFCRRVEEEIAFGLRNQGLAPAEIKKRTQEALEWMGLLDVAAADPFTLTRGERQLVALAAVLAMRPDVIVFDEPTTGLDGLAQEQMLERLRQLNRAGHTIIMIYTCHMGRRCLCSTHYLDGGGQNHRRCCPARNLCA